MANVNKQPDYAALVAEAEKAVSVVKDPELKEAAFTKVLDTLLAAATEHSDAVPDHPAESRKGKGAARTPTAKEPRKASGTVGYIKELIDEGFFKTQRTIAAVKTELGNRGHHIPLTNLSGPLQRLCKQKELRREKKADGNKSVFAYSKW